MTKKPECGEEIPELCKATFLSVGKSLAILWIVAGILISMSVSAVAFAMSTNQSITELKSAQTVLNEQINSKLDYLIKRKE